jgi:hypothetical protein
MVPGALNETISQAISICTARHDSKALESIKSRYAQILGQAYVFGMLGNWDSVQRLAMQAFALAPHLLADERDQREETYVSGREAAYFAVVSRRRLPLTWVSFQSQADDSRAWRDRYIAALELELQQHDLHLAQVQLLRERVSVEELAWQLQHWLHYLHQQEANTDGIGGFQGSGPDSLATQMDSVLRRCEDQIVPALEKASLSDEVRGAYRAVGRALRYELAVMALQVHVLAPKVSRSSRDRLQRYLSVLDVEPQHRGEADWRRSALLERAIVQAARLQLGHGGEASLATTPEEERGLDPFDRWRLAVLRRSAGAGPQVP